ncbi:hypothetical protein [Modestobacter lapidis]|nr:hypothetical protein [Modestobacter lapidis]
MPADGSPADVVGPLLDLGAVTAMLVGGFLLLGLVYRAFTGQLQADRRAARRARGRAAAGVEPPPPPGPHRPVELVAADLRRLAHQLAVVPSGTPVARRRGLLAAYDDVLVEAAAILQVPNGLTTVPAASREVERLQLVAALEAAGLVVSG